MQFYLGSEIKGAALRNANKLSDNDLNKDGAEGCTQLRAARETSVFLEGNGEEPRRHSERSAGRAESKGRGAAPNPHSLRRQPAPRRAGTRIPRTQPRARPKGFAKREAARAPGSGAPSLAPNKAETITFAYGRATRQTGAAFAAASDPSAPPRPRSARPPGAPQPRNADRPRPGPPPPGPAPVGSAVRRGIEGPPPLRASPGRPAAPRPGGDARRAASPRPRPLTCSRPSEEPSDRRYPLIASPSPAGPPLAHRPRGG